MKTMHKLLIALSCTSLIATGCAEDARTADGFTNVNSGLEAVEGYVFLERAATNDSTPNMDDLGADVLQSNSLNPNTTTEQTQDELANSCAASCREEAETAAIDCKTFAQNPDQCVIESRDVFATCFNNDCKNFGMKQDDKINPEQDFSASHEAPEMTCEDSCHSRYQDAYLVCLQDPMSSVDQCRDEAENGIGACIDTNCIAQVPVQEDPTQPAKITVDVQELCESACYTDAMDLYLECAGEANADVIGCRTHAIDWERTCIEQHCPNS